MGLAFRHIPYSMETDIDEIIQRFARLLSFYPSDSETQEPALQGVKI